MKQHDATYNRIESLVTTNELTEFMKQFAIVLQDIQTEEPFDAEDIISYLQIKMSNCPLVKTIVKMPTGRHPSQRHDW